MTLQFGVLGPLSVRKGNNEVRLTTIRSKATLARLLLNPSRPVRVESLIDSLYSRPVKSARNQVQRGICELRRHGIPISESSGAYVLNCPEHSVDAWKFLDMIKETKYLTDLDSRSKAYSHALSLWRGAALEDFDTEVFHRHATAWEESRLLTMEAAIDTDLERGLHRKLLAQLRNHVEEHPLHERFHAQLMLAYYRTSRTGDAIATYGALRTRLAEELGVDPSGELMELYQQILRKEPALSPTGSQDRAVPQELSRHPGPSHPHRQDERADRVHSALAKGIQVVTVTGPAGTGKTAVVSEAADRAAHLFPDGRLHCREPDRALTAFLRSLGDTSGAKSVAEQSERLHALLKEHRVLLVVDGVTRSDQVLPLLPRDSGSALLVTGRRPLALGGDHPSLDLPLGRLSEEESWQFLARGLGEQRLRAEPAATREVIVLCEGLPLALDVIVERLTAAPDRSIRETAHRLRAPDSILDELQFGGRHVSRALHESFAGLPPAAQNVLLAMVRCGLDRVCPDSVHSLLGTPPNEAQEFLGHLAESQLIFPVPVSDSRQQYRLPVMAFAAVQELVRQRSRTRGRTAARGLAEYIQVARGKAQQVVEERLDHLRLLLSAEPDLLEETEVHVNTWLRDTELAVERAIGAGLHHPGPVPGQRKDLWDPAPHTALEPRFSYLHET